MSSLVLLKFPHEDLASILGYTNVPSNSAGACKCIYMPEWRRYLERGKVQELRCLILSQNIASVNRVIRSIAKSDKDLWNSILYDYTIKKGGLYAELSDLYNFRNALWLYCNGINASCRHQVQEILQNIAKTLNGENGTTAHPLQIYQLLLDSCDQQTAWYIITRMIKTGMSLRAVMNDLIIAPY